MSHSLAFKHNSMYCLKHTSKHMTSSCKKRHDITPYMSTTNFTIPFRDTKQPHSPYDYLVTTEATTMGLFTRPFQVNGQPTVFLTLSGPSKASGTIGEPRLSAQERFRGRKWVRGGNSKELVCFFLIGNTDTANVDGMRWSFKTKLVLLPSSSTRIE
jgi:hypothetical protein